jgi:hypothetical protein
MFAGCRCSRLWGHSGGRDQEDRGSKPAQVNSSWATISKISITKKGW